MGKGGLRRRITKVIQRFGLHTVNRLALAVAKSGTRVPLLPADSVLALGIRGRKSGTYRLTPMGFVRASHDKLLVVAEHGRSDWVRNALAAPEIDIWIAGRKEEGRIRVAPQEDPVAIRRRIPSRVVAAANRALSHQSIVLEISVTTSAAQHA